jgi:hypothetical protein
MTAPWLADLPKKASALVGPLTFSLAGGHFRSAIASRSVDAFGNPIPWYTYPAVDFLEILDLSDCRVAEFGSGHSTLWWAKHAKEIVTFEADKAWLNEISQKAAKFDNVQLKLVTSPQDCAQYFKPDYFDIVIVDGGSGLGTSGRAQNAELAFANVRQTGLVIVDNTSADYCQPIIERANELGWRRFDLPGHTPGAAKRTCTSFFFRPEVQLLSGLAAPSFGQLRKAS